MKTLEKVIDQVMARFTHTHIKGDLAFLLDAPLYGSPPRSSSTSASAKSSSSLSPPARDSLPPPIIPRAFGAWRAGAGADDPPSLGLSSETRGNPPPAPPPLAEGAP
mmetsp:Transcript_13213/g.17417  ORF Transcript_13213/g.17417 Transcript_13213/m.17417 type:complete len:107 (+) Transcript_13213:95-415(+)